MRKEFFQEIEIPEGAEVNVTGNSVEVKGEKGENKREFNLGRARMERKENKISIGSKIATKNDKRLVNTAAAHVSNMCRGVTDGFEYKLKICHSHFPITVEVKDGEALIKNFLGEKIDRKIKIPEKADVSLDNEVITITSIDKEIAGQAAANFETGTKIPLKDRRVFQDGIFITNKPEKWMR